MLTARGSHSPSHHPVVGVLAPARPSVTWGGCQGQAWAVGAHGPQSGRRSRSAASQRRRRRAASAPGTGHAPVCAPAGSLRAPLPGAALAPQCCWGRHPCLQTGWAPFPGTSASGPCGGGSGGGGEAPGWLAHGPGQQCRDGPRGSAVVPAWRWSASWDWHLGPAESLPPGGAWRPLGPGSPAQVGAPHQGLSGPCSASGHPQLIFLAAPLGSLQSGRAPRVSSPHRAPPGSSECPRRQTP